MKIGIKRVAANTHEIYTRWGVMNPTLTIADKLRIQLNDKLDDNHRINKELRPDVYHYSVTGMMGNKSVRLDITISEKDIDLPALMNLKSDWCKRMIVVIHD